MIEQLKIKTPLVPEVAFSSTPGQLLVALEALREANEDIDFLLNHKAESAQIQTKNSIIPAHILITGGGFLAIFLMKELIKHGIKVSVVSRSRENFIQRARAYNCEDEALGVNFIEQNLNEHFCIPAGVDSVIHTAAEINALAKLNSLMGTNTLAAAKVFRQCVEHRVQLTNISTLSLFASSLWEQATPPQEDIAGLPKQYNDSALIGGYAQSKYLAEALLPMGAINIRPGLLCAPLGYDFSKGEFFPTWLGAMKKLGVAPIIDGIQKVCVDVSCVDWVASRICAIVLGEINYKNRTVHYHIASEKSVSLEQLCNSMQVKWVSKETFAQALQECDMPRINKELVRNSFFRENLQNAKREHLFNVDLFQSTGHKWVSDGFGNGWSQKLLDSYIARA